MKMKMKMTLMASALALAVAGQANAGIVSGTTGSSSLVLSIWDTTSLTSYVTTLGANTFSTFSGGVTGTNTALTASSAAVGNMSFAADAMLTSYLAGVNKPTTLWNVTAVDNLGTTAFGARSLLTTTNANIKSAVNSLAAVQQNTQVLTAASTVDAYYTSVGATTPATFTSASTAAYAGTGLTTNAKGSLAFNSTAAIGSTLNFWYLTPSSTNTAAKASVAKFNGGAADATWTLGANGNLNFVSGAPVAAVPEPGEWALMLSGFGLIGFIAMRRKNQNTSMTFA